MSNSVPSFLQQQLRECPGGRELEGRRPSHRSITQLHVCVFKTLNHAGILELSFIDWCSNKKSSWKFLCKTSSNSKVFWVLYSCTHSCISAVSLNLILSVTILNVVTLRSYMCLKISILLIF